MVKSFVYIHCLFKVKHLPKCLNYSLTLVTNKGVLFINNTSDQFMSLCRDVTELIQVSVTDVHDLK